MSLQSLQHRRLLSMTRRSGPQLPLDVASGRTARHAQGWKDQYDDIEGDGIRMLRNAVISGVAVWVMFGLLLWWAVSLLTA